MTFEFCRVVPEGRVDTEAMKDVDRTINGRKERAWPIVSNTKSIEALGRTVKGSSLV